MSKQAFIHRFFIIIKRLKVKPYSSFEEIRSFIEDQIRYLDANDERLIVGFSKRTLQRDIKEIRTIFGINIEYSKSLKGYFISAGVGENTNFQRILESFDLYSSLRLAQDLTPFIHLENRKPLGTENLYGLLHAIKNRLQITFSYQKFWEDEVSQRKANPLAMKEFKYRWYLKAKDCKDAKIKSFALDRLTNLEISRVHFDTPRNYNVEEAYRYCFGIINPTDEVPQEIHLSFDPVQGKYIKSLPLHKTQELLVDNEQEIRVKLKVCITHDLIMELLSFGDNLKVLKPARLVKEIRDAHGKAHKLYL